MAGINTEPAIDPFTVGSKAYQAFHSPGPEPEVIKQDGGVALLCKTIDGCLADIKAKGSNQLNRGTVSIVEILGDRATNLLGWTPPEDEPKAS